MVNSIQFSKKKYNTAQIYLYQSKVSLELNKSMKSTLNYALNNVFNFIQHNKGWPETSISDGIAIGSNRKK